jgi:hypothetical protein
MAMFEREEVINHHKIFPGAKIIAGKIMAHIKIQIGIIFQKFTNILNRFWRNFGNGIDDVFRKLHQFVAELGFEFFGNQFRGHIRFLSKKVIGFVAIAFRHRLRLLLNMSAAPKGYARRELLQNVTPRFPRICDGASFRGAFFLAI